MSQLDPELRHLIRWSRAANDEQPEAAPFGMASRIGSRWRETVVQGEPEWWRRFQVTTAWMSVGILVIGGAIWGSRLTSSASAYDFAPAYQLIARNIAP